MGVDKQVISELIRKQMAILGQEITMARVRNVPAIEIDSGGQVVSIQGDPQAVLADLINQFVELSGLIVKKALESIISSPLPAPTPEDREILTAQRNLENLNKTLNIGITFPTPSH